VAAIDPQPLIAAGRLAHQQLMVDACTISRPGAATLNRATSQLTPGAATQLYAGPCRVKPQRVPRNEHAGERLEVVARYELALPFSAVPPSELRVADLVTITASGDPRLVGQVMTVLAIDFGSTATAWRITIEDIT
jgi:hypothetical protein